MWRHLLLLSFHAALATLPPTAWEHQTYTAGVFLRVPAGRVEAMEKKALEVSDPDSPAYGMYLGQGEIADAIGIPSEEAQKAAEWLHSTMLKGSQPGSPYVFHDPHIVAHGDTVTMEVEDFFATYRLAKQLLEQDVSQTGTLAPPKSVIMLVTPPMPEGFCMNFTKEECEDKLNPCKWGPKTAAAAPVPDGDPTQQKSKSRAKSSPSTTHTTTTTTGSPVCHGAFSGWVCWREPLPLLSFRVVSEWRCMTPKGLNGGNSKRRRGRRHRTFDEVAQAHAATPEEKKAPKPKKLESTQTSTTTTRGPPPDYGFYMQTRSEGIAFGWRLNVSVSGASSTADQLWKSIELTFLQQGEPYNRVFVESDFAAFPHSRFAQFLGLKNYRPLHNISVCLNPGFNEVSPEIGHVGCDCEAETGWDRRLGRRCQVLHAEAPTFNPAMFITPRPPQTPSALRQALDISAHYQWADQRATQAVGEFAGQDYMNSDVAKIHVDYGLGPKPAAPILDEGPHGGYFIPNDAGEGSLDLQVITTLAPNSPTTWWEVHKFYMDAFMLSYAQQVNDKADPPLVHSISWGDAEASWPPAFIERLDYELVKLALRGITMVVSSGDNGISAATTDCMFMGDLIGSSPWITSVGATTMMLDSQPYCYNNQFSSANGACEEPGPVTCTTVGGALITSSGGFSLYRKRPKFQEHLVGLYLNDANCTPCRTGVGPPDDISNITLPCPWVRGKGKECHLDALVRESRGTPDVAVPGQTYPAYINGSLGLFDGTSASAPAFGAVVTLLNSEQLRQGRPPLGFLNPWLYKVRERNPATFVDVVLGDNGSNELRQCPWGWKAAPGWDPTTGLGVPRVAELAAHLPIVGYGIGSGEATQAKEEKMAAQLPAHKRSKKVLELSEAQPAPTPVAAAAEDAQRLPIVLLSFVVLGLLASHLPPVRHRLQRLCLTEPLVARGPLERHDDNYLAMPRGVNP